MRVGVIGCGYVFDHYMTTAARHPEVEIVAVTDRDASRLRQATAYYGLHAVGSTDELLLDPTIEVVVNLTSIVSHHEITRRALLAGKHVYSEKPLTTHLDAARELFSLAADKGLHLSCAPSNALSSTSLTLWKAVDDGAVGDVRLVYAEFDDNPIPLMSPEGWRSRSGAPWPYLHEYEMGCTWEHVGYHLTWMCAIFGPVRSVTAFSAVTVPDKTEHPLDPPDTPDFSVAVLDFSSGVVGRVTCSIAAPLDHRMRIIGSRGMLYADTYRHYRCPVYVEPFTKLSLNARKARSVRTRSWLQPPLGVGGRRVPLVPGPASADRSVSGKRSPWPSSWLRRQMRRELGEQDKMLGVAELVEAVRARRAPFPSPEFTLHLTELTLAIQSAGPDGASHRPETSFTPLTMPPGLRREAPDYQPYARPGLVSRRVSGVLDRLHRH